MFNYDLSNFYFSEEERKVKEREVMSMKKAMIDFFNKELQQTEHYLNSKWCKTDKEKRDSVWYAIQRCLGVAQFIQTCPNGLESSEVEPLYEKVRKDLENLLTNPT